MAGDRGAREFLQKHGLSGSAAQKLVQHYGNDTEEAVRRDPYACLTRTSSSSTFRLAPFSSSSTTHITSQSLNDTNAGSAVACQLLNVAGCVP